MVALETFPDLARARRLDAVDGEQGYLITDHHYGPIRLSASALHLLRAVQSGVGWDELARRAGRRGRPATAADVEAAYRRIAAQLAALHRPGSAPLPAGFWLRQTLIGRDAVRRAAGWLSPLFSLWPALLLCASIALATGDYLSAAPTGGLFDSAILWPAYLLFVASLIAHELGHATACQRFGAQPDDIGFTVYWIFPAFYSDVTAAWSLDRRQRVIVDLGGVFFQLGVGAAYWLAYYITGWQPLAAAFGLVLLGCLFALNPFFKLDGYWLLSDALGVPHLSRQPLRLWRHALGRLRGRSGSALPWPRWVTVALAIYTPASFLFLFYFAGRLLPELWSRAVTYPALLSQVAHDLLSTGGVVGELLQRLLISTFLLLICGLMIRQLVRRLARLGRRA